ncbi:hypothetical protein DSM112329_05388 [Paraconexibacter sp. AEG42_29]|uniref:MarR family transcriptional regulator n=1 Tax=Paraconexibacter sp. AEG42_29 TaxID=2997339 RepID=A0AAU7B389_9ACTN
MNVPVMQALRLKGMGTPDVLAAATGLDEGAVTAALTELLAADDVAERNGRFRVTREGRDRLDVALAEEREAVDRAAVTALYEEFTPLNSGFKELVHRWQLRDGQPNDHADAAYDAGVLADLDALHDRFEPLLGRVAGIVPRLSPYPGRFHAALTRVRAGESEWFLRPMIDSYHTVWFELHEDLIGLAGLTRLEEAAAGRAE